MKTRKTLFILLIALLIGIFVIFRLSILKDFESRLFIAIQSYDNATVDRIFLSSGKIEIEKRFGGDSRTLLHTAVEYRNHSAAARLLEAGANVNVTNSIGETPLYIATYYSDIRMINLLLKNGADLHLKEKRFGAYPLFLAVRANNKDVVEVLLAHGASPCLVTTNGSTALSISENGKKEISDLLTKYKCI